MCVDDVVRLGGGTLERVQIFILAEGLKFELVESCVHFDFTPSSTWLGDLCSKVVVP